MTGNLFAALPTDLPAELVQTLASAPGVRIERIVSHGHASPDGYWYDQDEAEWVAVLTGAARLRFEGGVADFLQVLDAERTQLDAEDQLAQAHIDAATSYAALYQALGGAPADQPTAGTR